MPEKFKQKLENLGVQKYSLNSDFIKSEFLCYGHDFDWEPYTYKNLRLWM